MNLKEQGRLLRQNEFLVWERKNGKKSLRQVFLFEDLILFSKARRFPDRKVCCLFINLCCNSILYLNCYFQIAESGFIYVQKQYQND